MIATIDIIILAMIKNEPQSAYELQKNVEARNISYWVKISTSAIYKKVLRMEEKGYLKSEVVQNGNMPQKTIYSITTEGVCYFKENLIKVSEEALRFFVDYNAVVISLNCVEPVLQNQLIDNIACNISDFKKKVNDINVENVQVPILGEFIILQQKMLADAMKNWIDNFKESYQGGKNDEC